MMDVENKKKKKKERNEIKKERLKCLWLKSIYQLTSRLRVKQ